MNIDQTISELANLSVDERLQIVQGLWDSIPYETEVTASASQRIELERRVAEHDADPKSAISRNELEQRLRDHD